MSAARPGRVALAVAAAVVSTGGIRLNTSQVQLRSSQNVTLETASGETVLPAGAASAVVDHGSYGILPPTEYEIRAQREPTGSIELECEGCDWPSAQLLDASGRSPAVWSWLVHIEDTKVTWGFNDCMSPAHHGCSVPIRVRMAAPARDVVEVRRRSEPVRLLGYFWLVGGLAFVAAGTAVTFGSGTGGATLGDRAPIAIGMFVPGLAFSALGLWHLLAPVQEQVWRPVP